MYIKKISTLIILAMVIITSLLFVSCTSQYTLHRISYDGDPYSLITLVIRNKTELDEYFSQEDYITKGEYYEESTSMFTDEFFLTKVLIPILYSKENYVIKGVKLNNGIVEVILKFKSGLRPAVAARLCFIEVNKKDIGNATEAKVVYK